MTLLFRCFGNTPFIKAGTGIGMLAGLTLILAACGGGSSHHGSESSCAARHGWPSDPLGTDSTRHLDASQFISVNQLKQWHRELDALGLRDTGGPEEDAYIRTLAGRLDCAGVRDVTLEPVTFPRWSTDDWRLTLNGEPLPVASYIPYSGSTPEQGVTAPTVYVDITQPVDPSTVAGRIVLFDVPNVTVPTQFFLDNAMQVWDPLSSFSPDELYSRPYLAIDAVTRTLDALGNTEAVGAIGILQMPYETAHGSYFPYDGIIRQVPALYVDRDLGAQLKGLSNGTELTLRLPAKVADTTTHNVVAMIPGASDEITVIHSHTDGTNGLEDNGPDAIIGIAQYLARLPQSALPRTVMVMFSSGHFAGGVGIKGFLQQHADDDLLDRIKSIITVEHLGAQRWEPDSNGILQPTGLDELACFFAPRIPSLADAAYRASEAADAGPVIISAPLNPDADAGKHEAVWPGEGQYFYSHNKMSDANYITGPNYLLNWGVDTVEKTDFQRVHALMMAFTRMVLDLSEVPGEDLSAPSATNGETIAPPEH
ncbi:PA domain protein [Alcanivorax sp. 24]|uniref:PA domain protein n=1 Tax=Alcanivorax sp. 24 TaxID=2545266 RepID=UPI001060088A|nr:PA domain protein [Alcanivorax sp. 24]